MEGLKFEYEGTTYNVSCMPNKYWREALLYYGDCPARLVDCQDSMCYCCIYHRGNQKARKAFYYECFPEEKPVEAEKCCKECANYKPKEEPKKLPKLTQEVFNRPDCPEWAQYAAVDSEGKARWYQSRPWLSWHEGYWCGYDEKSIPGKWDFSHWKKSIVEKPCHLGYTIITRNSLVDLERIANVYMDQGWLPQGGAVKGEDFYMQIMIK